MKSKTKHLIMTCFAIGIIALVAISCNDDDDNEIVPDQVPTLTTTAVFNINENAATSGGNISDNYDSPVTARGVCWGTNPTPNVSDNKTVDGLGNGPFESNITGLSPGQTYYVRAYATNAAGTGYGSAIQFLTLGGGSSTVTDPDGNIYNTVTIGTQIWLKENLKTTKYNDGSEIVNIVDNSQWNSNLTTGAYCNIDNQVSNTATYGRLYNWYAISTGKLAPAGWHVPTDNDWTILENYLIANGYSNDGIIGHNMIAKSLCAKTNWDSSSIQGGPGYAPENNNSTGFTAFPAGYRHWSAGSFYPLGIIGLWWSSTESSESSAYFRSMQYEQGTVMRNPTQKKFGYSVRLVKD